MLSRATLLVASLFAIGLSSAVVVCYKVAHFGMSYWTAASRAAVTCALLAGSAAVFAVPVVGWRSARSEPTSEGMRYEFAIEILALALMMVAIASIIRVAWSVWIWSFLSADAREVMFDPIAVSVALLPLLRHFATPKPTRPSARDAAMTAGAALLVALLFQRSWMSALQTR